MVNAAYDKESAVDAADLIQVAFWVLIAIGIQPGNVEGNYHGLFC